MPDLTAPERRVMKGALAVELALYAFLAVVTAWEHTLGWCVTFSAGFVVLLVCLCLYEVNPDA